MTKALRDQAPSGEILTEYDLEHMIVYLRIFDAAAAGADWREVVRIVFERDPEKDPDAARRMHDSHLERARWMARTGFRQLLPSDVARFSKH